ALDDLRQRGVVTAALTPLPPATETGAAGFEDEATHPLRRPEAQAEGHPRSERVAGDVHPLQALRIQQREELIQRPIEGGVGRDGALAVTRQVRRQDPEPGPEQRPEVAPCLPAPGESVNQEQRRSFTPADVGEQAHGPPSSSARATAAPSAW